MENFFLQLNWGFVLTLALVLGGIIREAFEAFTYK